MSAGCFVLAYACKCRCNELTSHMRTGQVTLSQNYQFQPGLGATCSHSGLINSNVKLPQLAMHLCVGADVITRRHA